MKLWSDSFKDGCTIPTDFAFGKFHDDDHVQFSENLSPHLAWSEVPSGTESLVLICHDSDVPSVGDNVNKEGVTIASSLPRVDFFHWVMVDISPATCELAAGAFSKGVLPGGKDGPDAAGGARSGINDFSKWFAGDPEMGGEYFGYDGPCPPWNDSIVHHYHFSLYALDVFRTKVDGVFTGADVQAAIQGNILERASFFGNYSLNPAVQSEA